MIVEDVVAAGGGWDSDEETGPGAMNITTDDVSSLGTIMFHDVDKLPGRDMSLKSYLLQFPCTHAACFA